MARIRTLVYRPAKLSVALGESEAERKAPDPGLREKITPVTQEEGVLHVSHPTLRRKLTITAAFRSRGDHDGS